MDISDREFSLLKDFLFQESGIDVADEKRYLFTTRLSDFLKKEGCKTFSDLHQILVSGVRKHLRQQVIELMTTHESGFLRDEHPFTVLTDAILPEVSRRRAAQARFLSPRLRILSAGCSFGQEPYSIALCIKQWLPTQSVFCAQDITIIGIDISTKTLDRAKKGMFTELELGKQLSLQQREKHFHKCGDHWQLSEDIRSMVAFQQANIINPLDNLGKFDIIFCRNVIIYFSVEGRKNVLGYVHRILEPQGVLFLGSAESLYNLSNDFLSQSHGQTTYYTKK